MEEEKFKNKLYSYMFYALAGAALVASIFFYNALLFGIAAFLIFLSALYYSSGHLINNMLLRHSLLVEIYNEYRLSDNIGSAVKRIGNDYKSVSAAVLRPNRGISVGSSEMLALIEGMSEPFEFSIAVMEMNKKALLENLETKRRMREISLARLSQGTYDKTNEIKRELEVFEKEIEGIRSKGKALDVSIRIRTCAVSPDEIEAARSSYARLVHVSDAFSTVLNADYSVLKGEELLLSLG